jgi:hypothetical protein
LRAISSGVRVFFVVNASSGWSLAWAGWLLAIVDQPSSVRISVSIAAY